ncbi:E2/UBC family protein [Nonlabens xiamenensis]|uniref:E2/UBC family protein n=1 Tax=Nonlabens xiamenensis TaxID=2341043 RepID=UPI000F61454A|nr:E2/UBC family protein [Nonlabens xiamenensis]
MTKLNNNCNLKDCYYKGEKPIIAFEYTFNINDKEFKTRDQVILGETLHSMNGSSSDTHFIYKVIEIGKVQVGPKTKINLTECGIERFIILPFEQEVLDIEDCYCEGSQPYITFKYRFKVNRIKYETLLEKLTREQIIEFTGKDPAKSRLRIVKNGKPTIVEKGEIIDLTEKGVERFILEPLDCTEGFVAKDCLHRLTHEDELFLNHLPNKVDFISERNLDWVILRNFELPDGYNHKVADVAIMIHPQYPVSQLDMIYFSPCLQRADGKHIGALTNRSLEGKTYQQWSRHRNAANKWDPNVDNVESHLDLMMANLELEFKKR